MSNRREISNQLERGFRHIYRRLKREVSEVLGEEMNGSEYFFLRYFALHGPQKPSTLSTHFDVSASHVTHVTDRLVKKGWVHRRRSSADKRVIELEITPEGTEVHNRMEEKRMAYFHDKFNSFTTEELETLLRLFRKLAGN